MTDLRTLIVAGLVGIGGTAVLDLWAELLKRGFRIPATNWRMVGRWIGHMRTGSFVQPQLAKAPPITGEALIGWGFHFGIGAGYGLLLLLLQGESWLRSPTLLPPLLLAWALLVLPFFVMMPGMGSGIAGSKTPKPNFTRLKSIVSHTVFGLGMFGTATLLKGAFPSGS